MLKIVRSSEPEIYSNPTFIEAKNMNNNRFIPLLKDILRQESQNRCVYCRQNVGITSKGNLNNFYPKSLYPALAYDWDNIFFACDICDRRKKNTDPILNGELTILHPVYDDIESQLIEKEDGTIHGNNTKAANTIDLFDLNRQELIDQRQRNRLVRMLIEDGYLEASSVINNDFYNNFVESIENLESMSSLAFPTDKQKNLHLNMIYANVITSLETYLSDAFINTVTKKNSYKRKFVKTFKDFSEHKFGLNDIYDKFDNLEKTITKALLEVIYHNIPKVKGMYKDTLGVSFPKDIELIYAAVTKRHDIVHRNGKDKTGTVNSVTVEEITKLITEVKNFVDHINSQLISK
ncbi:HEPN domain-containing protein [Paenibacillus sp. 276b]|uniref:HEPN domain-containing protein n=1 Tax=Paenibacillus sp. 276b TaxID=1566277 RepID=UPI0008944C91|nr:HEPN domain-containing protein [Paenibacillus sp. 276b]SEB27626.1 TIGR02646 family protein [Paenibacillus sp. 276b]